MSSSAWEPILRDPSTIHRKAIISCVLGSSINIQRLKASLEEILSFHWQL